MEKIKISFELDVYGNIDELDPSDRKLMRAAMKQCDHAYAPYSNYFVGAALLLEDGQIILGSNQENAAYPSGLCAERVAIYAAGANFPGKKVKKIAITARKSATEIFEAVTPCGACRQAMSEYENLQKEPFEVLLTGPDGKIYVSKSVDNLLPLKFSSSNLSI
jgi:cytidine deaminase